MTMLEMSSLLLGNKARCYIFGSAFGIVWMLRQKLYFTKQYSFPSLLKDVWLSGYWSARQTSFLSLSCLPSEHLPGRRCARSEAPKLRNLIAVLCSLLSHESAPATRFSLLLLQTVKLPVFCWYESAIATRISFHFLLKLSKLPVFPATSLPLLPDFRCCPGQPWICPCYPILSQLATKLSMLPVFHCY